MSPTVASIYQSVKSGIPILTAVLTEYDTVTEYYRSVDRSERARIKLASIEYRQTLKNTPAKKEELLQITLPADLKNEVYKLAYEKGISVNSFVRSILRDATKKP